MSRKYRLDEHEAGGKCKGRLAVSGSLMITRTGRSVLVGTVTCVQRENGPGLYWRHAAIGEIDECPAFDRH
jgi:hypothetical protein